MSRPRHPGDAAEPRGHTAAHHAGLFFVPKIEAQRVPVSQPRCLARQRRPAGQRAAPRVSPETSSLCTGSLPTTGPLRWWRWSPALCRRRADQRTKPPPRGCGLQPCLRRLAAGLLGAWGCWEHGAAGSMGLLGAWASWSFPCACPCGLSVPPPPAGPEQRHCNNSCKCERSGDKGRSGQRQGIPVDKQH